jgi:phosphoenolpyruvate carboxylase
MDRLETPDKDLPLRDDIRLLGRILGDTVRSQEGEPVFAIVEQIRRTSIRFHRDEDEAARQELEAILNSLSHGRRSTSHPPDKSPRAGRFRTARRHHGPGAYSRS